MSLSAGQHVEEEEGLSIADPREPRAEAPGRPPFVLRLDRSLFTLPVLAVGRVGDQMVEAIPRVPIVGEGAAEGDLPRVPPRRILHEVVRPDER